jgi:hypothetical protein
MMMLFLSMSQCDFIKTVMKYYGSTNHSDDLFLTGVGIISFVSGGISKFVWGVV